MWEELRQCIRGLGAIVFPIVGIGIVYLYRWWDVGTFFLVLGFYCDFMYWIGEKGK